MMMCSMFLDPLQPDLLCEEYVLVCAMFPDPLQLNLLYEEYMLVCAMFPDPLQPNLLCDGYMGGGGGGIMPISSWERLDHSLLLPYIYHTYCWYDFWSYAYK